MIVQPLSFRGAEGKAVHCLLYRLSEKAGREPGVILVPGRPLFPTDYEWLIRPLLEAGFVVAGLFPRGYGSEGLDDQSGPRAVDTVRRTAAYLVSQKIFRGRIGLVGHSSGGQAGLLALAEEPRIRAAVSLSVITDLESHTKAIRSFLPAYEANQRAIFGGDPDGSGEAHHARSPALVADQILVPVLFMVGEMDRTSPVYQSRMLHEELCKRGVQSRLVVVKWAGHFFQSFGFKGYLFEEVISETSAWLKEHLIEHAATKTDNRP